MGLPYSWQANCVAAKPYDKTQPPEPRGLPEHVEINFGVTNPADHKPNDPMIYIIPKQDYVDMWTAGGDNTVLNRMSQLEDMVLQKGAGMKSSGMPVLPVERASSTNDLAVQGKYLDFGNWSGIRFVGRFSQGLNPVVNHESAAVLHLPGLCRAAEQILCVVLLPGHHALPAYGCERRASG